MNCKQGRIFLRHLSSAKDSLKITSHFTRLSFGHFVNILKGPDVFGLDARLVIKGAMKLRLFTGPFEYPFDFPELQDAKFFPSKGFK